MSGASAYQVHECREITQIRRAATSSSSTTHHELPMIDITCKHQQQTDNNHKCIEPSSQAAQTRQKRATKTCRNETKQIAWIDRCKHKNSSSQTMDEIPIVTSTTPSLVLMVLLMHSNNQWLRTDSCAKVCESCNRREGKCARCGL